VGRKLKGVAVVAAVLVIGGGIAYSAVAQRTTGPPDLSGFARRTVNSADGTAISYLSIGGGPGVIVVPGALTVAADYAELARDLSKRFTVHVVDRRGHGASGPQADDYSVGKEVADLAAVRAETDARYLFGHSFGGFVAMETAMRHLKFTKLALYEPGVSIDGSVSTSWMEPAERHIAAGEDLDALTEFVRGTSPEAATTPHWLLKPILPLVITKDTRRQMYELMPAAVREHRELARRDGTYTDYAQITIPTMIMSGGDSDASPGRIASQLADVMTHAETASLKGLDHFGPDQAGPEQVSRALTDFFLR
jgi:pimeloyl-ACP methyl ester carboxylesterase